MLRYRHPHDRRKEGSQQKLRNVRKIGSEYSPIGFRNAAALSSGPPPLPDRKCGAHLPDPQAVPPANALDPSFDLKNRVINYYWAYMFLHYIAAKRAVGSSG